jgi:hypothetical protein
MTLSVLLTRKAGRNSRSQLAPENFAQRRSHRGSGLPEGQKVNFLMRVEVELPALDEERPTLPADVRTDESPRLDGPERRLEYPAGGRSQIQRRNLSASHQTILMQTQR